MNSTDWPVKNKEDRQRRATRPATQSEDVTTMSNSSGARKHPVLANSSLAATSYSPEDEPPFTEEAPLTTNAPFTEEDIEILEEEHRDLVKITPETLVYAWEAFAKEVGSSVHHSCCSMPQKT